MGNIWYNLTNIGRAKLDLNPQINVVLITGCDSGFGEMASRALSAKGFPVVAACLTEEGVKRLRGVVTLSVVCDVTKQNDIDNLVKEVSTLLKSNSTYRLWAVVNNAGIGPPGNIDWATVDAFRKTMDVNFFAVVAMIKATLPLLKRTNGSRIINLSSMAGFYGNEGMGAYAASKHAVEGLAKSIRPELAKWGIHVSNINPGFMKTPIVTNAHALAVRNFEAAPEELQAQYSREAFENQATSLDRISEDPMKVTRTICELITDANPPLWNFVGILAAALRFVYYYVPRSWVETVMALGPPSAPVPRPEVLAALQKRA